jgi:hypothetical protein
MSTNIRRSSRRAAAKGATNAVVDEILVQIHPEVRQMKLYAMKCFFPREQKEG